MKMIFARDFGIFPNTTMNYTDAFMSMFNVHPSHTTFILEKGTYTFTSTEALQRDYSISNTDVASPRYLSLLLKDMSNIVIDGAGSQFIYEGQTIPLALDHCEAITLQNITIDWKIPLSAEGTIVGACQEWVDIQIDSEKFPHFVKDNVLWFKGETWEMPYCSFCEFDSVTKKVAYRTGDTFSNSTQSLLEDGTIRFHGNFDPIPTVGNFGVLRHNHRLHPGIFVNFSQNLTLSHITIHNTGGLGILAQFCENLSFNNVRFEPSPIHDRHFVSGHDDGLHLSNNKGTIHIENCWFRGLMDDPVNVHGTTVKITEQIDAHTLKCIFVEKQSIGFDTWAQPHHMISFIDHLTMSSRGQGKVTHYELITPQEFIISFEESIPSDLEIGDSLENLTNSPALVCKDNYFGSCRARGLLISTPKPVLIENNVFESAGSAILIAGDANYWYESGGCNDVIIRGNHFSDCCMTAIYQFCEGIISICPEIPSPQKDKPFHRNIRITDNTFLAFDYSVLYALSVQGLEFSHNKIIRSHTYKPFFHRKHMLNLAFCSDVTIHSNRLIGGVLGQDISICEMTTADIHLPLNNTLAIYEEIPTIQLMK